MPGATLPNIGIVVPSLDGDSGTWDDLLNTALGAIDEHDHTAGNGLQITTAALDIDADLTIAGFGLTNVGRVAFSAVTALASGARALFVSSADNELYYRTSGGVNVKLTNGTSINTSLVGGIVGDYTSVGAEVAYDDANDRYTFKQQGSKPWARIASADVRLYEFGTTESVYVGLKAPAALVSSWDVTMPLAAPASTMLVQMSAAGVLSASNVLPVNTDIVLSGTGKIQHGEYTFRCGINNGMCAFEAGTAPDVVGGVGIDLAADTILYIPITFQDHWRLKTITLYSSTPSGGTVTVSLCTPVFGAYGTVSGATTTSPTATTTLTPTTPIVRTDPYYLRIETGAGADIKPTHYSVTYDVPA